MTCVLSGSCLSNNQAYLPIIFSFYRYIFHSFTVSSVQVACCKTERILEYLHDQTLSDKRHTVTNDSALVFKGIMSRICWLLFVNATFKFGPSSPAQSARTSGGPTCLRSGDWLHSTSYPARCYWLGATHHYAFKRSFI